MASSRLFTKLSFKYFKEISTLRTKEIAAGE